MTKKQSQTAQKKSALREGFEFFETWMMSFALMLVMFTFFFTTVIVNGPSMESALHQGQRLVIAPVYFDIKQRDIVVIRREDDDPMVKRVIATAGQTVDIDFDSGFVFVDGERLDEPYLTKPIETPMLPDRFDLINFPAVVPEGHVFVLGDNRNNSSDSRFREVGMIQTQQVFGEVIFRIFPFGEIGVPSK